MRLAVVADIHGNLRALEAVIADMKGRAVDQVVNLGDTVSGPLEARQTAELLMTLGWPTVRGNCDHDMAMLPDTHMSRSDASAARTLSTEHLDWLRAMPASIAVTGEILACHGTPRSDRDYLVEDVSPDGRHGLRNGSDIAGDLAGTAHQVVLCAHSHIPRLVQVGGMHVFNPGSVGLPAYDTDKPTDHIMESGSPHARYGIVEKARTGWRFEHHSVVYDWGAAAKVAEAGHRPEWATALRTGRM